MAVSASFVRIQEAINNASDGDTIIVHSGVYYENVVVDKSVTLKGNGQPVVDGGGKGDAITLSADGITLEGFTATNSGSSYGNAGIKITSNNNIITGNTVSNNKDGIYLDYSSDNIVTGNNASSSNNYYCIHLDYSRNNIVTDNNVCNNNGAAIDLYNSNNNNITGNNVSNNDDGIRIWHSSSNNSITGNNICNNDDGISLRHSSTNNTITGNTFVNGGLSVYDSYKNTVEENNVNGKPLVYLEDVSDHKVEDAGQVIIVNCNNISIENLDLSNTSVGIAIWNTNDSKVLNKPYSIDTKEDESDVYPLMMPFENYITW